MLLKVSEKIAECLMRAHEARQRAVCETNKKFQAEWLEMEKRWLRVAESLRFVEQANRLLDDGYREKVNQTKNLQLMHPNRDTP